MARLSCEKQAELESFWRSHHEGWERSTLVDDHPANRLDELLPWKSKVENPVNSYDVQRPYAKVLPGESRQVQSTQKSSHTRSGVVPHSSHCILHAFEIVVGRKSRFV